MRIHREHLAKAGLWSLIFGSGLGGLFLLVFLSLPFEQVRALPDWIARDGLMESFTLARFTQMQRLRFIGAGMLLFAGVAWWQRGWLRDRFSALLAWLARQGKAFRQDIRAFILGFKLDRTERRVWGWVLLLAIALVLAMGELGPAASVILALP